MILRKCTKNDLVEDINIFGEKYKILVKCEGMLQKGLILILSEIINRVCDRCASSLNPGSYQQKEDHNQCRRNEM